MTFEELLKKHRSEIDLVENLMGRYLDTDVPMIRVVGDYVLKSGGKRFRPMLVLLCSRMCGVHDDSWAPYAVAVEFIHTASLLHDDVIDRADIRRGQASANHMWGDDASVLVGDYLFTKSFLILAEKENQEILKIITDCTTVLAEGEVFQVSKSGDIYISEEEYLRIVVQKTAVLMSAACQIGAILGKKSGDIKGRLGEYGLNLGIAFQIIDDALDFTGDSDKFGKIVGKDLIEGDVTLPLIHTLRRAGRAERRFIINVLSKESKSEQDRIEVSKLVRSYGGIDFARERAKSYVKRAVKQLRFFEDGPYKKALGAMADFVIDRSY